MRQISKVHEAAYLCGHAEWNVHSGCIVINTAGVPFSQSERYPAECSFPCEFIIYAKSFGFKVFCTYPQKAPALLSIFVMVARSALFMPNLSATGSFAISFPTSERVKSPLMVSKSSRKIPAGLSLVFR